MIISLDAENDKNSITLYDKSPREIKIQGTYLNIVKAVCSKPIPNINLNG